MSSSDCCFLTCIQISQEVGQVVWNTRLPVFQTTWNLLKNFPQFVVIHTVKGFGVVKKAEIDVFLGTVLLFLWSNRCWKFDPWFLCLFWVQLEHLKVHSSLTVEGHQGQGHWIQQRGHKSFWRKWPYHGYSQCPYHSLASGQTAGREHSPEHQQKMGLKIYWTWPCPSEQDPIFPTVSFSLQEASTGLLFLSIRGQTEWKPRSQKTNQTDHMDHSPV